MYQIWHISGTRGLEELNKILPVMRIHNGCNGKCD